MVWIVFAGLYIFFFHFPRSQEKKTWHLSIQNIQVFRYSSFAKVTKQFLGLMLMKLKKVTIWFEHFEYQKTSCYFHSMNFSNMFIRDAKCWHSRFISNRSMWRWVEIVCVLAMQCDYVANSLRMCLEFSHTASAGHRRGSSIWHGKLGKQQSNETFDKLLSLFVFFILFHSQIFHGNEKLAPIH